MICLSDRCPLSTHLLCFNRQTNQSIMCNYYQASCFHSSMNALALDDACCYGHHLSDQMLSYDAATGQTLYVGPTNEEVLVMGDPTSETYAMPYIYSSFAWSHCDDPSGVAATDINYLLDKMAYTNLADPSGAYTADATGKVCTRVCLSLFPHRH